VNVSFFLRKPKYPIICDIDGYVIAARSKSGLEKQLSKYGNFKESQYPYLKMKAVFPNYLVL